MEPMIDLEHLVKTERIQNRARRDAGDRVLMWFNAGCMMVIGAGVAACAMTIILPIQCQLKFPVAPVYLCVVFHCLFHCL